MAKKILDVAQVGTIRVGVRREAVTEVVKPFAWQPCKLTDRVKSSQYVILALRLAHAVREHEAEVLPLNGG